MNLASSASAWRGSEYYRENKVLTCEKLNETSFKGMVSGSNHSSYDVLIDLEHPRKSKCNCPHANGKRIICKHMVALYFSAFPEEAENYYNQVVKAAEEEEQRQETLENALIDRISKMNKEELQQALLQLLFDGPEWQYERFLRENVDEYWE